MKRIDIDTDRLRTSCWVSGPENGTPILLIHGNLVTGRFWRDVAARLPNDARIVAPDLRGFGAPGKPIDATRGLDDWIDDVRSPVKARLDRSQAPRRGWSRAADGLRGKAPCRYAKPTLVAPMSPYGFGSTRDRSAATTPDAGSGGRRQAISSGASPRGASSDEPMSSPRVTMAS
jgi:hypothetical protein